MTWRWLSIVPIAIVVALSLPSCGTTTSTSSGEADAAAGAPDRVVDGGGPAPVAPNGVKGCPAGACNYQSGSGCDANQACRPQFTADAAVVGPGCEPAGAGQHGDACKAQADCAAGHYCAEGVCRKQCCAGDWTACDADESCIRQVDVLAGGKVLDSGLALCFPVNDCDPLDPSPCAADKATECKIVDAKGSVACSPRSSAKAGDDCAPPAVCAAGLTCVLKECRKLCKAVVGETTGCTPADGACVHFSRDPADIGECTPKFP